MIVVPFLTLSHVRRHRCCWQERQQTRTWPDMSHSQIPPCRSIMDLPRPDASLRWSSPWALTLGDSRTCDESARITIVYVPANQRRSTLCHNITACGHFHMQWYYDQWQGISACDENTCRDLHRYCWTYRTSASQHIPAEQSRQCIDATVKFSPLDMLAPDVQTTCIDRHVHFMEVEFLECSHSIGRWPTVVIEPHIRSIGTESPSAHAAHHRKQTAYTISSADDIFDVNGTFNVVGRQIHRWCEPSVDVISQLDARWIRHRWSLHMFIEPNGIDEA